ncbi:MAG: L,D-transpeptidase [Bacteroidota bacterium]
MLRSLVFLFCCFAESAHAQPSDAVAPEPVATAPSSASPDRAVPADEAPIFYVVRERPRVFSAPDSSRAFARLDFREGVRVIEQRGAWSRIVGEETVGWVASAALSNVWVMVDKASRNLYVYRGAEVVRRLPADVSQNPDDDKVRRADLGERDHYRIPEGSFFITSKNLNSQYYRSLMLSYPNAEDAARGLEAELISEREHDRIVEAAEDFRTPPMGTKLGGAIAIHGQGSGRQRAWTRGCVALRDVHLDAIWDLVEVGTPVLIQ